MQMYFKICNCSCFRKVTWYTYYAPEMSEAKSFTLQGNINTPKWDNN